MHFIGKECDVVPYTDAYETIQSMPIVQADTANDNPETGETIVLILNEAIWMDETMDHTLLNPFGRQRKHKFMFLCCYQNWGI